MRFLRRTARVVLFLTVCLVPAAARSTSGWLHSPLPAEWRDGPHAATSLAGAAHDLIFLYRHSAGLAESQEDLRARFQRSRADLKTAPQAAADVMDSPVSALSIQLLRLRLCEEMALRVGAFDDGVDFSLASDSLEAWIRTSRYPAAVQQPTALALAAGMRVSRLELASTRPAFYEMWRRGWFGVEESFDPYLSLAFFHFMTRSDVRALDDVLQRPSRGFVEAGLRKLVVAARAGHVALMPIRDPGRRLLIGLHSLSQRFTFAPGTLQGAERLTLWQTSPGIAHAEIMAGIDSLHYVLDDCGRLISQRSDPQHSPSARALRVARAGLDELASFFGERTLAHAGMAFSANLEPKELVPGKQAKAQWHFRTTSNLRFQAMRGTIQGKRVGLRNPPTWAAPDTTWSVETHYAPVTAGSGLGNTGPGAAVELGLRFHLEGTGEVRIVDHAVVSWIAPLHASLDVPGGPVMTQDRKTVSFHIASQSPSPLEGRAQVLSTTDWQIEPARSFVFRLRRPGQSVTQAIDLVLPPFSTPGPYDFALRLEVEGNETGTLRTTLIKPVTYVIIGPYEKPNDGRLLAPEKGINLDAPHAGWGNEAVYWNLVPEEMYDIDGALDFDSLYERRPSPECACALTMFESPDAIDMRLVAEGASRVWWNGVETPTTATLQMQSGRNILLARACRGPGRWRLLVNLYGLDHEPLRVVDNDLSPLLDGVDSIRKAKMKSSSSQRLVKVNYRAPQAQKVSVLGAFNAWVPAEMEKLKDGSWQRELILPPGRYAYKILVDGQLHPDPGAELFEPDGFGGRNSLLIVR